MYERASMDKLTIEQVIVGNERRSTSEIGSESVESPLQSYQHENLQCFQCFITFSDWKAKDRHFRRNHRDQYKQQMQQANVAFACYKCDKGFSSSHELSQHQASHGTEEKPFHCRYCLKSFFTYSELNKHKRSECVQRKCNECGILFPTHSQLRKHLFKVHHHSPAVANDLNTFQCCKCDQDFQTEEELLQHQERYSNDLNCNVKAKDKNLIRQPKGTVEGISDSKKIKQEEDATGCNEYSDSLAGGPSDELKPELKIPCPEADCDLIFPSIAALRAHKKDQHGPPSRKTHACTQCNESYTNPKQLKSHLARAHRSTRTRGKSFARESALKVHENTRTKGEKVPKKR